ncbi:MAG: twin-arginine translocation signal domain-containing protein [Gammaproteobacteria bacterium]|jgi:hypothetical protein
MKKRRITDNNRREFLTSVAVVGCAAGAGGITFGVLHSAPGSHTRRDDPRENSPSGYRLTEHIRTYYDKARI